MRHNPYAVVLSIPLATGAVLSGEALSQSNQKRMLEEVVVTAQRREQNLQDVPISMSSLDQSMMLQHGISDTSNFSKFVPNLRMTQNESGSLSIAIRGIGNNFPTNLGFESTVGTYIDGVYASRGFASLFELGDVQRVEVLRGPQGTLYGRNTIGGAINIISVRPSGEFGGKLRLGVGNENLRHGNVSVDFPALGTANEGAGQLLARASIFYRERDGFTEHVPSNASPAALPTGSNERFGDIERQGAHIALDWHLRENLRLSYDYMLNEVDDTPRLFQLLDVAQPPGFGIPPGFSNYIVDDFPSRGSADQSVFYQTETDTHALQATWNIGEVGVLGDLTLKSISAYREIDQSERVDLDGTNTLFFGAATDFDSEVKSQELQLSGTTAETDYVIGLYYFNEEAETPRAVSFGTFGAFSFTSLRNGFLDSESRALFGQIDWTPSSLPAFTLSAGARRTWEEKGMDRLIQATALQTTPTPPRDRPANIFNPDLNFQDWSVMVSPSYDISENSNLYFKFSQGFRSGGYDGITDDPAAAVVPFDSEEVDAYELGQKSRWFDNTLRLDGAVFYTQYTDQQLSSFDGGTSVILNAGETDLWGAELELTWLATESLQLQLNYSYLDYDIKEFDMGTGIGDVADRAEMNNAPEHTAALLLDYSFGPTPLGVPQLHLSYTYEAEAYKIAINSDGSAPDAQLDSRSLLDMRLSLSEVPVGDNNLELAFWGKNLTDEEYMEQLIPFGLFNAGTMGWPRTYGLEATLHF